MWLLKRKKQVKDDDGVMPSVSDKVAGKIAGAGLRMQRAFGNKMNKLFENMNQLKLKRGLIVFTLLAGSYSLYLIVTAITKPIKQNSFKVEQIDVPKHFNKTGDEIIEQNAMVDEETYTNIQQFKKYMDSLKFNNTKQYDSILITRPGLIDSVQMLEQIYYSQKIK
jgi:hypothetical protein